MIRNRPSVFVFIALFFTINICWAQLEVDRASLRRNNRVLQSSIYFAKSNHTTVDLSENVQTNIKKIDFLGKVLKMIDSEHKVHLLVNETINKTYCTNSNNIQSFGLESKSAGIVLPKLSVLLSQTESFSLYKDHIIIGGRKFLSPLYNPKYYNIRSDISGDTIQMVFEPLKDKKYLLKGSLKLHRSNKQIIEFHGKNSKKNQLTFDYLAKEKFGNYYPYKKHTELILGKKENIIINSNSTYFDYKKFHTKLKPTSIVLDNDKYFKKSTSTVDSARLDSIFGNEFEQTKKFFNTTTNPENAQNTFEDLYLIKEGKLPISIVNIRLNRLLNFNTYEGLRAGIGAETNESFNETFSIGGYVGYGLRDSEFKYGSDFTYILDRYTDSKLRFEYNNTLSEPGRVNYALSKKLFGNEGYRKFGLENIQRETSVEATASTQYFKWIALESGFKNGTIEPYFAYNYLPLSQSANFNYQSWNNTIRITPREKFIKSYDRLISVGSKYPTIWINAELGKASGLGYQKWNLKIEKKFKFVVFGDFTMELLVGYLSRDLPYPFLYNIQGSYNPATPIISNSFMTMGYNEFISDRYLALFLNHNFGEIFSYKKIIQPELVLIHNTGFGSLEKPENHDLFFSGSIEKGYYESGFYLKNLIVLQNLIGKTGLGAGFLYRYGPYRNPNLANNFVFKFALDFEI